MAAQLSLEVECRPVSIAIFNVALIGHVNPTFPLVAELVRRGCKVHYFLPPNDDIRLAAEQCGAHVESYLEDDPQDFELETCGLDELPANVPEAEMDIWERATWPLASTLQCGPHVISRCRDLGVQVVLYDPTTPHGLLVAGALGLPCASLVTFPGMGALSSILERQDRAAIARAVRLPLATRIMQRFGVDLHAEHLTRRQYLADENLITTSQDLVAPLPEDGQAKWADEIRGHFNFEAVGCMVDASAPHVAALKPAAATESKSSDYGKLLPVEELKAAKNRGAKVVYAALGTMALSARWAADLGGTSGGNVPKGTTGKEFCHYVWRALLRAFELLGDEYICVLCVGTQPDALDFVNEAALPSNVIIRSSVPQVEMLSSYTDVFVSHVGFNSLQESVYAGVPLIAIPQAVDQPSNAMLAEHAGWGRAFMKPMESVTEEALRQAIADLAAPGAPYKAAVIKSQALLKGGETRAADRLIAMAEHGATAVVVH